VTLKDIHAARNQVKYLCETTCLPHRISSYEQLVEQTLKLKRQMEISDESCNDFKRKSNQGN
jgi:hypothetical protein